jgi:peptide/nickel transport system permease protein
MVVSASQRDQAQFEAEQLEIAAPDRRRRLWQRLLRDWTALLGLVLVIALCAIAIFAPLVAPYDPLHQDITNGLDLQGLPVFFNANHWLGTDNLGRDMLSRLIYGARVSLVVGIAGNGLAVLIGTVLGAVSGYASGWPETLIMRFTDIMMGFPILLFAVALISVLSPGLGIVIAVIALSFWTSTARIVHGQVLSLKQRDFVEAARAAGCSNRRIIMVHILPHLIPTLLVYGTLGIAATVLFEATLSYLGIGVQPPTPSWGEMAFEGSTFYRTAPWLLFYPGICIFLTVLSFNLLGDGLRDALDPYREQA